MSEPFVVIFPVALRHLRMAVCPRCWWGTSGERMPQEAARLAAEHEEACTGEAPRFLAPGRAERNRRLLRRYGTPGADA